MSECSSTYGNTRGNTREITRGEIPARNSRDTEYIQRAFSAHPKSGDFRGYFARYLPVPPLPLSLAGLKHAPISVRHRAVAVRAPHRVVAPARPITFACVVLKSPLINTRSLSTEKCTSNVGVMMLVTRNSMLHLRAS